MTIDVNFDHNESALGFYGICLASVTGGLVIGGFVDAIVRKFQKDDENWKTRNLNRAIGFFVFQATLNIFILFSFARLNKSFVPWLQLTISGALFAVLLFTAQRNMVDNILRITNF
jgi:hypothetical protein